MKHQDEAKEAWFAAPQVTIHPVVMYYEKDEQRIRDSMIFLSDDISHDNKAVDYFLKTAIEYLQETIPVDCIYIFSDGCTSQYKGTSTIANMSQLPIRVQWNFLGSDHGKCEADGEVGVLNKGIIKLQYFYHTP